jgi:hypothetical protein
MTTNDGGLMPSHHRAFLCARRRSVRLVPFALASLVLPAAFASSAGAATPPPPTPQSATNCQGGLTPAPTSDELNLLTYKFVCDQRISSYTLIVNRRRRDVETIDNFSTTADVFLPPPNGQIDPANGFTCEGALPGDAVSCNDGAGKTALNVIGSFDTVTGTFDLVDPYCASYTKLTKKVKKASGKGFKKVTVKGPIEPQAYVQLLVTDNTGAQNGPFRLARSTKCPKLKKKPGKH